MSYKPIECPQCGAMLRSKYEARREEIISDYPCQTEGDRS